MPNNYGYISDEEILNTIFYNPENTRYIKYVRSSAPRYLYGYSTGSPASKDWSTFSRMRTFTDIRGYIATGKIQVYSTTKNSNSFKNPIERKIEYLYSKQKFKFNPNTTSLGGC